MIADTLRSKVSDFPDMPDLGYTRGLIYVDLECEEFGPMSSDGHMLAAMEHADLVSALAAAVARAGAAAESIAAVQEDAERRISQAQAEADRRALAAEAAAAKVAQRAADMADAEAGKMQAELTRRLSTIEAQCQRRVEAAEESARAHAMALEETSMEASRRIRKLEEASAQRIRELEEASERCISLEKHFAEERIAQAEAAAEQRAKAAEEAAAAVARRIAEVEDSAAQQRAVAAEELAAQYAMGLEAMVGVAARRAAHSAAAQVALALHGSPSRTATLAHVNRTGVGGAWDDASTSEAVPADFLPGRGSEVLDRVGLRLRVCVDMADSVEGWLTANARTSRESTSVNIALRSARLHLVTSSERLGDDDTFLEALTELLAMRHALLPLLSSEGVEEEAAEADCR